MSDDLVSAAETARVLGVSRQRVAELATEAADFPIPETVSNGTRIWSRHQIEVWAVGHPERGPRYKAPTNAPEGKMPRRLFQILTLASDEARRLHHSWVGPDHLLLALLHPECPGAAKEILAWFEISLKNTRNALVERMGDPFEESSHGSMTIPPATQLVLERAKLKAFELTDEEVTSQHVLLALTERWRGALTGTPIVAKRSLDPDAVRQRVIAMTEETRGVREPLPPRRPQAPAPKRIPRTPEPELAPTLNGKNPHRRGPWGSAVFHDAQGRPLKHGHALRQYFIDRDGNPVLTTDGRPVHHLVDEDGRLVLDEVGEPILVAVDVPSGSVLTSGRMTLGPGPADEATPGTPPGSAGPAC
jgi:hypothetical protein